jgi:hypothetical protein
MTFLWLWRALTTDPSIPSPTTFCFCGVPVCTSIHWCNNRIQNVDLLYVKIIRPYSDYIWKYMMANISDFRLSSEIMKPKMKYRNTGFFCFCDILDFHCHFMCDSKQLWHFIIRNIFGGYCSLAWERYFVYKVIQAGCGNWAEISWFRDNNI